MNSENNFDELIRNRLEHYSEPPDMEFMQPIRVKTKRIVSLYRIGQILGILLLAGAGLYTFILQNDYTSVKKSQVVVSSSATHTNTQLASASNQKSNLINQDKAAEHNVLLTVQNNLIGKEFGLSVYKNASVLSTNNKTSLLSIESTSTNPTQIIKSDSKEQQNRDKTGITPCKADFNYYTGYKGEKVFSAISEGEGNLTYLWEFGDGQQSRITHPEYLFKKSGTYTVSLTVTDSKGCVSKQYQQVSVLIKEDKSTLLPNSIKGIVKAGADPVSQTRVLLIPVSGQPQLKVIETKTNIRGEFEFIGFFKGNYFIQAFPNNQTEYFKPTFWGNALYVNDAPDIAITNDNEEVLSGYSINLIYEGSAKSGLQEGSSEVLLLDQNNQVIGKGYMDANGKVQVNGQLTGSYKVMDPNTGNISGEVDFGSDDKSTGKSSGTLKGGFIENNPIVLSPNPAETSVNIGIKTETQETVDVVVRDAGGAEMMRTTLTMVNGNNQLPIDISILPDGIYYVMVIKKNGNVTSSRLVKNDLSGR